MPLPSTPWRDRLQPASYRGAGFHVDTSARAGGRRGQQFEYPKKDQPVWEDLGRRGRRFGITAYVLGADYEEKVDALLFACEAEGAGLFIHPSWGRMSVACINYNLTERRQAGGSATFDLTFVESGEGLASAADDTAGQLRQRSLEARRAFIAEFSR